MWSMSAKNLKFMEGNNCKIYVEKSKQTRNINNSNRKEKINRFIKISKILRINNINNLNNNKIIIFQMKKTKVLTVVEVMINKIS